MEKEMNILRTKCFPSLLDFFLFQGKCKIKQSYNFSHTFISIKRKSTFCLVTFICTGSLTMGPAGFSLNKCLDMAWAQMKGAASFCLWLTKEKKIDILYRQPLFPQKVAFYQLPYGTNISSIFFQLRNAVLSVPLFTSNHLRK